MANLKFSQFTLETSTANITHIVGYNAGTNQNVRITTPNVLGAYLPLAGGVLTGDLSLSVGTLTISTGDLSVAGAILDSSGSAGGAGEFFSSTGTGTDWVASPGATLPWPYVWDPGNDIFMQGEDPSAGFAGAGALTTLGMGAGESITSAKHVTFIGHFAGWKATTEEFNTAVGSMAFEQNNLGQYNTVVGYSAFNISTGGSRNTFIGAKAAAQALLSFPDGNSNVAIGYNSMPLISGASRGNVAIGADSGFTLGAVAEYNVIIGHDADVSAAAVDNEIVIGYNAVGHGANIAVIGNASGPITSWEPGADNTAALGSTSYGFKELVLNSPDGTAWTITVDNAGAIVVT